MFEDFFGDLEKEFEDRVVGAVVDVGFDAMGVAPKRDPKPALDLKPVLDSLTTIMDQGSQLIEVLQRPTETAGNELCQRAATALSHGWFDDSLRDALASVEKYPYRATPYLIGALAAFRLGDLPHAMRLLVACVKYSANGEREVGAVAALLGAGLAKIAELPQFSISLLQLADRITERSCPPVVAALAAMTSDPSREDQLVQLWWAAEGGGAKEQVAAGWSGKITAFPSAETTPYSSAGVTFRAGAAAIAGAVAQLSGARDRLLIQLGHLESAVGQTLPANDALDSVLKYRYGIRTPLYSNHTLKKTLLALIQFDNPNNKSDRLFMFSGAKDIDELRRSLGIIRLGAHLLMDLVNLGMESPRTLTKLVSDWPSLGLPSQQLLYKLCSPAAASTWPGSHQESGRVLQSHSRYLEVWAGLIEATRQDNIDAVSTATKSYQVLTGSLPELRLVTLPANPWLPNLES